MCWQGVWVWLEGAVYVGQTLERARESKGAVR